MLPSMRLRGIATIAALVTAAPLAAHANLVADGGFDQVILQSGSILTIAQGSTQLPGWSVVSGNVDIVDTNAIPEPAGDNGPGHNSIDMNGITQGAIEQAGIATVAGIRYQLSFDLGGNFAVDAQHSRSLDVKIGSLLDVSFSVPAGGTRSNPNYIHETLDFIAAGPTDLTFTSTTLSNLVAGAELDNVSIEQVAEPASIVILGGALAGLAGLGARRRRRAAR